MDEADAPHQEVRARLAARREVRTPDVEAGDDEGEDARRGDPVHRADRRAPEIDPREVSAFAGEHALDPAKQAPRAPDRSGASRHCTFTSTTSRPCASRTCTPQAMQGSNEWIVRRISSGRSGSTSG